MVCPCYYTLSQMEELLQAMGLPQYIDRFRHERVTGSILLQCDEAMLQRDLGIDNQLHRKRLIALITGHQSVKDLQLGIKPHLTHTTM